jgi:Domain of unknown function (DUF4331)
MSNQSSWYRLRACAAAGAIAAIALVAGCGSDSSNTITGTSSNTVRTFDQVQRLGNPLVSEVFLAKKDHAFHGSIGPDGDVAAFAGTVKGFVAAFRPQATTLQNTLASVLLPDMLIVQTDKAPSTAGWLSWALSNGWGGRKLGDDVVDVGLSGIFSDLLDPTQAICKPFTLPLCTDNVGSHSTFLTTFPYLAAPK